MTHCEPDRGPSIPHMQSSPQPSARRETPVRATARLTTCTPPAPFASLRMRSPHRGPVGLQDHRICLLRYPASGTVAPCSAAGSQTPRSGRSSGSAGSFPPGAGGTRVIARTRVRCGRSALDIARPASTPRSPTSCGSPTALEIRGPTSIASATLVPPRSGPPPIDRDSPRDPRQIRSHQCRCSSPMLCAARSPRRRPS